MIQLIWPWAYILLPLPFIIRKLLPSAHNKATAALKVPFFKQLLNSTGYKPVNAQWPFYVLKRNSSTLHRSPAIHFFFAR